MAIGPGGLAGATANARIRPDERFVFASSGLIRMKTPTMNLRRDARDRNGKSAIAPVEMPGLDNHLCFALYAASNHMTRLFVPFLNKLGVTYPQYLVLVVLWERGAQGVGEMALALQMDLGTLSPMLKRLEAKGLVTRRRQAKDERRVLVDLTPKGVSLRKRTEQMLGEFYCFLNMPLDELFDLKDQLHHFVSSAGPKEVKETKGGPKDTKAVPVKLSEPVS
jgi:MarR family transcriptional regulator, organic hydroperoxide resistance regulator